ncbi:hypothetical protein [Deinococcus phoenicis]|uniref:hypothetical protein n=1 Tax=Deinococcus phoenicis TaxID=1476583 RepID=UPI0012681F00|nr:hypothetical protein [Deinococcus phoenicis]
MKKEVTRAFFQAVGFALGLVAGIVAAFSGSFIEGLVKSGGVIGWIGGLAWFCDPKANSDFVHPPARIGVAIGLLLSLVVGLLYRLF